MHTPRRATVRLSRIIDLIGVFMATPSSAVLLSVSPAAPSPAICARVTGEFVDAAWVGHRGQLDRRCGNARTAAEADEHHGKEPRPQATATRVHDRRSVTGTPRALAS